MRCSLPFCNKPATKTFNAILPLCEAHYLMMIEREKHRHAQKSNEKKEVKA